ncbi:hypothetical protein HQ584_11495 [Patescibacteria group bacterium]|nr:hypothetical protein [Patescibacteria group bacterium]
MDKKECEQVKDGSWYRYFSIISDKIVFDDETMQELDKLIPIMWGDFFERNLLPEKGPVISLGAGYGRIEIPFARRGYQVIGLDNDYDLLRVLTKNAENTPRVD